MRERIRHRGTEIFELPVDSVQSGSKAREGFGQSQHPDEYANADQEGAYAPEHIQYKAAVLSTAQASASSRAPFVLSLPIPPAGCPCGPAQISDQRRQDRQDPRRSRPAKSPTPSENRIAPFCQRPSRPIAASTWLGSRLPDVQALPAETATPAKIERDKERDGVDAREAHVADCWRAAAPPPLIRISGTAWRIPASRRSRSARTRSLASGRSRRRQLERARHSRDPDDVLRPWAAPKLLTAAMKDRRERHALADVEEADAFGPLALMRRE